MAADGATTSLATDAAGSSTLSLPDGTTWTFGLQPDPRFGLQAPIRTPVEETRPDGVRRQTEVAEAAEVVAGDPLRLRGWSRTTKIDGQTWLEALDPATPDDLDDRPGRAPGDAWLRRGWPARPDDRAGPTGPNLRLRRGRPPGERDARAGPTAATTRYGYDPATGRLTITRPDGLVDQIGVDANGRTVRTSTADGATTRLSYDPAGRLIQVRPPGHPSSTLGHSAAGRPTGFLPPVLGDDVTLEVSRRDKDGAVMAVDGPGDRAVGVSYDAAGRPSGWRFDQGTSTASYDPAGRLSTLAAPGGIATAVRYTGAIPSGLSWSGPVTGDVKLAIDAMGRTTSQSVGATSLAFAHDPAGLLTKIGDLSVERDPASGLPIRATAGTTETTWSYDGDGLLVGATTSAGGVVVLDRRYERDSLRRIAAVVETRAGLKPTMTVYGYDPAGRLATIKRDGTIVEQDVYDPAGNRVSVTTPTGKVVASYDDRDRLEHWGSVAYVYAPDGTLASWTNGTAVTAYAFDDLGALREATLPDGRKVEYLVDGAGRRVGRRVDGRLVAGYLYRPDGLVVGELDESGALAASFGYDDQDHLALIERAGLDYRVVTDQLGSPLIIIDAASGQVAESIGYDAWGKVVADTKPGFQPFGFAGGLRDLDTGLVHFGARDYDPLIGRWTGPDPIRFLGGDGNLYRYVAGDPVNRADPTGLDDWNWDDWNYIACTTNGCTSTPGPGPGGLENPPPPPPPPPTPPPPAPQNGGSGAWSCGGVFCGGPNQGGFCFGGHCSNGSGGWTCTGLLCSGPNGEVCFFCSTGDPHFRTGDGRRLDFQAAGEFLVIQSPDKSVVVQARQVPFGSSTLVTLTTAVAVSVAGDRVAVYVDDERPLSIGGKPESRTDVARRLPHGGIVERHGSVVTIDWPDGSRLTITREGGHLDYGFVPDAAIAPTLSGLLGSADGDVDNDLTGRDGRVLDPADPDFATKLYREFGQSWRIGQAESLFDYRPGESTATFTIEDFPRAAATVEGLDSAVRSKAEVVCRALGVRAEPVLSDCILDVGITGDPSYAASAAAAQAATQVSRSFGARHKPGPVADPGTEPVNPDVEPALGWPDRPQRGRHRLHRGRRPARPLHVPGDGRAGRLPPDSRHVCQRPALAPGRARWS